ncbi:MAG TPA: class I SAM-dependent methyltransferase [Gemmatimonadales bacterium]|nr:class I SAM-dependent methyltransferase [Gemmatimonadales bacterium]
MARVDTREAVRKILFEHPALTAQTSVVPPRSSPLPLPVLRALPSGRDSYEISRQLGALLAHLVLQHGHRSVLEFGAGASSRVVAAALEAQGGGMLTSVEADPSWCADAWMDVEASPHVDSEMVAAPVSFVVGWWGVGYAQPAARERIAARGPYDLLLIDAPGGNYGRLGTLPLVGSALEPGATIVVDDAAGHRTQWLIACWLRMYPDLRLWAYDPTFADRGMALLRWRGGAARVSGRAWVGSVYHALSCWRRRREG